MTIELWMMRPGTARALRALSLDAAVVGILWLAAAGYARLSAVRTLATARAEAAQARQAREEAVGTARRREAEATRAVSPVPARPNGAAVTDFNADIYRMAQGLGLMVAAVHVGKEGDSPSRAAGGAPNTAEKNDSRQPSGAAGNGPGRTSQPPTGSPGAAFDCSVIGAYPALIAFLDRLAESPQFMDLTGIALHRGKIDRKSRAVDLQMRLSGSLSEIRGAP